jgi:hypothetical protein
MSALLAVAALCTALVGCHDHNRGRTISRSESYSTAYLSQLLRSRVSAEVRTSGGHHFTLHRIVDRDPNSDEFGMEVFWLEFQPHTVHLAVSQISSHGDLAEGFQLASGKNDFVVLNGGYWDSRTESKKTKDGKETSEVVYFPLGLVTTSDRTVSPLRRDMAGGVVYQTNDGLGILPTDAFEEQGIAPTNALQCKPLLVHQGGSAMISDDHKRDDRLAIGIDRAGGTVVVIALGPHGALTLFELAQFLLIPASDGGPECQEALNLDGGPGARLFVPALNMNIGRNGSGHLNNVIRLY